MNTVGVQITIDETEVMGVCCLRVEVRAQNQWVIYGTFEEMADAASFAADWAQFFIERLVPVGFQVKVPSGHEPR